MPPPPRVDNGKGGMDKNG